jgi:UDP-3-O-[3-hydroxymyristoyl] glucosamine N-acyltransferase
VTPSQSPGAETPVKRLTAREIAEFVAGELSGDGDAVVHGVAALDRAGPGELSFLANRHYAALYRDTRAGVVLIPPALRELPTDPGPAAVVVVDDPHAALLRLLPQVYREAPHAAGIHETARIGRGVRLGEQVSIGAYAVIGDNAVIGDRARIGDHVSVGAESVLGNDVILHSGCTLYARAQLGSRVIIHSGARIGCDGFGYVFEDGQHRKLMHVGRCVLEDDVEVGANSTIDRGSVDDTVIGAGTKIDNLVQIGHNVRIGKLCLLMSQVGVAGSVRVGDGVILAGQVGVAGHLTIGDGARIAAQAGVVGDVPAGETWSGYPARPHREALRASAATFRLVEIIRSLERLVAEKK